MLVVAAAGNNGDSQPFYPAGYPGVLSVAGTDPDNKLYPWSNRGSWVAVAAPGCDITTFADGLRPVLRHVGERARSGGPGRPRALVCAHGERGDSPARNRFQRPPRRRESRAAASTRSARSRLSARSSSPPLRPQGVRPARPPRHRAVDRARTAAPAADSSQAWRPADGVAGAAGGAARPGRGRAPLPEGGFVLDPAPLRPPRAALAEARSGVRRAGREGRGGDVRPRRPLQSGRSAAGLLDRSGALRPGAPRLARPAQVATQQEAGRLSW